MQVAAEDDASGFGVAYFIVIAVIILACILGLGVGIVVIQNMFAEQQQDVYVVNDTKAVTMNNAYAMESPGSRMISPTLSFSNRAGSPPLSPEAEADPIGTLEKEWPTHYANLAKMARDIGAAGIDPDQAHEYLVQLNELKQLEECSMKDWLDFVAEQNEKNGVVPGGHTGRGNPGSSGTRSRGRGGRSPGGRGRGPVRTASMYSNASNTVPETGDIYGSEEDQIREKVVRAITEHDDNAPTGLLAGVLNELTPAQVNNCTPGERPFLLEAILQNKFGAVQQILKAGVPGQDEHSRGEPWLHEKMENSEAAALVDGKEAGTYLVRKRADGTGEKYALTVVYQNRATHHLLKCPADGNASIGKAELSVSGLREAVDHLRSKHTYWPVPLRDHIASSSGGSSSKPLAYPVAAIPRGPAGEGVLHTAVKGDCKPEIATALIKAGVSVHDVDGKGRTPLHYACQCSNPALVKILLDHTSDVNARDNDGNDCGFFIKDTDTSGCREVLMSAGN